MVTRLLPREEWARLEGTELEAVYPVLPDGAQVVIVENGDELIACWAVFPLVHLEGVWIHPDYRHNPRVARRLVAGGLDTARAMGARTALTAAADDRIATLAQKIGGVELPGRHFSIKL
jgi:ribosomal protein S18 acetylase RimI-like enzyme